MWPKDIEAVRAAAEKELRAPAGTPNLNPTMTPVSYTHLRAHETVLDLVCRLLLENKNTANKNPHIHHLQHTQSNPVMK